MKLTFTLLFLALSFLNTNGQSKINVITTDNGPAGISTSYEYDDDTYEWGKSPYNIQVILKGFRTIEEFEYSPINFGSVKFRRADNSQVTGGKSLVWVECKQTIDGLGFVTNHIFPEFDERMESLFDKRLFNVGAENLFQNTGGDNVNNIERMDWIMNSPYNAIAPNEEGFAIFERGNRRENEGFFISAITGVDGGGNPSAYGPIVKVNTTDYGPVGTILESLIVSSKKISGRDFLVGAESITEARGGVFISLQDLQIAKGTNIYGYSLFANDLPASATPADLVDYTNQTFFPRNTNSANGGIDVVAVTGFFERATVVANFFTGFSAVENKGNVTLKWNVENEKSIKNYSIERSVNGVDFEIIGTLNALNGATGQAAYTYSDNVSNLNSGQFFYRVKQVYANGSANYSSMIPIKKSIAFAGISLFPNPVNDFVNINISSSTNQQIRYFITNAQGQQIRADVLSLSVGNNSVQIANLGGLPAGIYNMTIREKNGEKSVIRFLKK